MALTGFVERIKGKVKVTDIVLGPATATERTVTIATSGTTTAPMPNAGLISVSSATTTLPHYTLGPPFAGAFVTVYSTAASTGVMILSGSSTGSIAFGSTNFVLYLGSSTAASVVAAQTFQGVSTLSWMPTGGYGVVAFATA